MNFTLLAMMATIFWIPNTTSILEILLSMIGKTQGCLCGKLSMRNTRQPCLDSLFQAGTHESNLFGFCNSNIQTNYLLLHLQQRPELNNGMVGANLPDTFLFCLTCLLQRQLRAGASEELEEVGSLPAARILMATPHLLLVPMVIWNLLLWWWSEGLKGQDPIAPLDLMRTPD